MKLLADVLFLVGAGCLVYAAWRVDPALAWAVAGGFALAIAAALAIQSAIQSNKKGRK